MRTKRRSFSVVVVLLLAAGAACSRTPPTPSVNPTTALGDAGGGRKGSGQCTPWQAPPSDEELAKAAAADGGTPPADDYPAFGRKAQPDEATNLCAVADSNLARAEAAILASSGSASAVAAHVPWNHKSTPERFEDVARRLSLTKPERALLNKNGFVVSSRHSHSTYAWALHEIYQSELPIYISADSILHAVYTSNDHLLADIERETLAPLLARTLSAMHCTLADASRSYPSEIAHDLDLYLTVARSLLAGSPVPSVYGTDDEAGKLVASALKASGIDKLELFGRERLIDWSQYQPRGHYGASRAAPAQPPWNPDEPPDPSAAPAPPKNPLTPYFRAGMWLSRLEFNLVSRSSRSSLLGSPDPRETPREAIVALALSDLVDRAHVSDDVGRLDRAWALLAGKREDVSVANLSALRKKAKIDAVEIASFEKLKAAIGNDFQRTARIHPMPEGSTVLPAITTFLGPRIVADTAAFRPLVHSEVNERYLIGAGDVAYVLGLDHGKAYLKDDLAKHANLAAKLDEARNIVATAKDTGDLYGAWLGALRGVAEKPKAGSILPSFMSTPAYDDLRMNTLVAGYGQIRHNYVLMAAQAYDEGGCEIPDGYVEPMPSLYGGIASYAARGASVMKELDPKDKTKTGAYFAELEKISRVLQTIAQHELEGRALSIEEKRFLSMVIETTPGGTGGPPTYTGWYFDMFRGRWEEALTSADFVADYYTSSWKGKVVYAGAHSPRLGAFVIDAGGSPRMAVGPVANAFEVQSELDKRLDDASVLEAPGKKSPWSASYTGPPSVPEPPLAASVNFYDPSGEDRGARVVLRAPTQTLTVTMELLDHHRRPIPTASATRTVPKGNGKVVLFIKTPKPKKKKATDPMDPEFDAPSEVSGDGIRIRVGDYTLDYFLGGPGSSSATIELGGAKAGEDDFREKD